MNRHPTGRGDSSRVKAGDSPDDVYAAVVDWATEQGLELYPHQDEAVLELLGGANVVLATPTGSGKSLVAVAAHAAALARDQVTYYTAPIKALVSEKFFELCATFGTDDVGMLTGDASVNADAPVICCTAEILANIALREGQEADVGLVVMDEFHYYAEPDRGWAWQVPLLELPRAQFVLMSATLGDLSDLAADLTSRTGRETAMVTEAERPVPLTFTWALTPLPDTLEELVTTHQAPAYVVHFTQKDAVEHATSLLQASYLAEATARACRAAGRRPVRRRLRQDALEAAQEGDRRPPRRDAAALPAAGGAAGPGRAAHRHLRHRHPRRRHQRADPDGAVHRAGQVRRPPAADPAHPRVPPDRRAGRAGRLRHRRIRRGAGARARHRERARQGEVRGEERRQPPRRSPSRT